MKTDNTRLAKLIHEAQIKCEEEVFRCYKNRCRTPKTWDEMLADELISKGVTIPVRCGNCKHNYRNWEHEENDVTDYSDITCDYFMTDGMDREDFCSYGERKEDGHETQGHISG